LRPIKKFLSKNLFYLSPQQEWRFFRRKNIFTTLPSGILTIKFITGKMPLGKADFKRTKSQTTTKPQIKNQSLGVV